MKTTLLSALITVALSGGAALAQQNATSDIYAQPPYGDGSTSTGSDGTSTIAPNTFRGGPDYGVATRGLGRTDLRDNPRPHRQAAVWHHDDLLPRRDAN